MATIEFYDQWRTLTANLDAHYFIGTSSVARVVQGLMAIPSNRLKDWNKLHRLWIHELCRVFGDRLTTSEVRKTFLEKINQISVVHFKQSIDKYLYTSSLSMPSYDFLPKIYFSHLQPHQIEEVVFDEVIFVAILYNFY